MDSENKSEQQDKIELPWQQLQHIFGPEGKISYRNHPMYFVGFIVIICGLGAAGYSGYYLYQKHQQNIFLEKEELKLGFLEQKKVLELDFRKQIELVQQKNMSLEKEKIELERIFKEALEKQNAPRKPENPYNLKKPRDKTGFNFEPYEDGSYKKSFNAFNLKKPRNNTPFNFKPSNPISSDPYEVGSYEEYDYKHSKPTMEGRIKYGLKKLNKRLIEANAELLRHREALLRQPEHSEAFQKIEEAGNAKQGAYGHYEKGGVFYIENEIAACKAITDLAEKRKKYDSIERQIEKIEEKNAKMWKLLGPY